MLFGSDHRHPFSILCAAAAFLTLLGSCAEPTTPESLIGTPPGYEITARLGTSGYAQSVALRDTVAFLGQGEGGLFIAAVTDRRAPRRLAELKEGLRGYNTRLAVRDSVVYIAAGDFGVSVVNAPDPLLPSATATNVGMRPARALHLLGSYVFAAVSEQGVRVADLTEPTQPDVRGGVTTPGYARSLCTTPDSTRLLVACGELGLAVFDITDLAGGFGPYPLLRSVDAPGYAEDVVVMDTPGRAALACGTAGVVIVDYADSLAARVTAVVPLTGSSASARAIVRDGSLLVVAAERGGIQLVSVAAPDAPRHLGTIPTPWAAGVALDRDYIYVADRTDGLIIIRRPPSP